MIFWKRRIWISFARRIKYESVVVFLMIAVVGLWLHSVEAFEGASSQWKGFEKIACIYLEAPVCDIKSWPGGKGVGAGSSNDWKNAQQAYGLDEAGLLAWDDNPFENLEALAKTKVPIYTAIGLQDKIVPPYDVGRTKSRRASLSDRTTGTNRKLYLFKCCADK